MTRLIEEFFQMFIQQQTETNAVELFVDESCLSDSLFAILFVFELKQGLKTLFWS